MKITSINTFVLLSCMFMLLACSQKKENSKEKEAITLAHAYKLDSVIEMPVKFHPEIVSTNIDKFNTSLSPDGNTVYYSAAHQKLGITGIAFQKFENGKFGSPNFVPFVSPDDPMADVQISPNGNLMLFSTSKDYEGKPEGFNFNIWTSKLKDGVWQEPSPLGAPIASLGNEFYPVMTSSGNLYFNSDKGGNSDIYFSRYVDGEYQDPIRLPDNINSERKEADAFVARDESYIIFVRVDESDGFGNSDLYISFNEGNNVWTDPINMGPNVNSDQIDGSPYVTPDGNYLIFTTGRKSQDIKDRAVKSYQDFRSIVSSSNNGSLNFYIMDLDVNKYKR